MITKTRAFLLSSGLALASLAAQAQHSFSGTLDVVSDYDFRGVSQTDRGPALQLGGRYDHEIGFYAGIWASNVDFADDSGADLEVDLYFGFQADVAEGINLDFGVTRYTYPGTRRGVNFDYNEFIGRITFAETFYGEIGYSADVFRSGARGIYYAGGTEWVMPADVTLDARLGYYDLDRALDDSYLEWSLGATRSFGPVDLSLRYHDTDGSGEDLFGKAAKARLILGLHLSF